MAEQFPLTQLPRALVEARYVEAPNHRAFCEAAKSARIPAQRSIAGR